MAYPTQAGVPVGAGRLGFSAGGAVAVVFARTQSLTYLPAYLLGVLISTQPLESVPVTVVPTGILPTRTELVAGLVRTLVVWNVERVTVVEVAAGAARLTAALPATVPPGGERHGHNEAAGVGEDHAVLQDSGLPAREATEVVAGDGRRARQAARAPRIPAITESPTRRCAMPEGTDLRRPRGRRCRHSA